MLESSTPENLWRKFFGLMLGVLALLLIALAVLVLQTPIGEAWARILNVLFAANSVQALWYVTRAAGIVAYLLLWLSTAWGLAVSNKIFDPILQRAFTYDAHEFLSLLAIGFTALHIVVLLADRYLPFSVAQVLVPFAAPYRPVWVGVGVIGLYLTLLVTITFYLRRWIGIKTFRAIHYLSFMAYAAVTLHGWFAGTDTPLRTTQLMYGGTALVILFLTVFTILVGQPRAARIPSEN
jgi:predicted ferric reductase